MINFPTSLDALSNPASGDALNANGGHALQHANANDAIEALEAKVGVDSSAVTTSLSYKLGGVTGTDKAVSLTGTEVLTNKTLTSPQINLASNATGDIYYRNGSGVFTRLAIGTSGQILQVSSGGIPEWIANPSAADASTTVKGVVEIATDAEMNAGTSTGATGAILAIAASSAGAVAANKLVQFTSATKYPAADGSLITNLSTGKASVITTNTAVTGTGVATDFYSVSIPANTLSTNNGLVGKIYFTLATASTTSKVITMKFGSTTIGTATMTSDSTGSRTYKGYIDFMLLANAATNAQEGSFVASAFVTDVANNGTAAPANLFGSTNGTAAEDSTGALTLAFQITQNSGDTFTAIHSTLTKLQ